MEDLGYTPGQIDRNRKALDAEASRNAARAMLAGLNAQPPGQQSIGLPQSQGGAGERTPPNGLTPPNANAGP
jgi:hypothetical protein